MIELLLFQRRLEGLYLVDVDFKMVITEPCFFLWPGGNQPNQILLHKWRFVVVDNAVRCCCCERMDLPLESLWRKKVAWLNLTQLDSTWLNLTQLDPTWLTCPICVCSLLFQTEFSYYLSTKPSPFRQECWLALILKQSHLMLCCTWPRTFIKFNGRMPPLFFTKL